MEKTLESHPCHICGNSNFEWGRIDAMFLRYLPYPPNKFFEKEAYKVQFESLKKQFLNEKWYLVVLNYLTYLLRKIYSLVFTRKGHNKMFQNFKHTTQSNLKSRKCLNCTNLQLFEP